LRPCTLVATDIALTLAPESDAEKVFPLFPEYMREGRRGQIHEIEYSEIDWGPGLGQTAGGGVIPSCNNGGRMPSRSR